MQVRFSPPPVRPSPLGRLDARWRLAGLLLALVTASVVRTPLAALAALAAAAGLAVLVRLDRAWFAQRVLVLAVPAACFVLPIPLLSGVGFSEGLRLAGLFALKAAALATLASVVLAGGPLDATLKAAHALWVPGLLVQVTLLSYRYLFVLGDELGRLRVALRARGFRNRANWHSYRTVGGAAGALLVRGYERAERVGHAMRCRGFDGQFRALAAFRTRRADVLFVVLAGLGCAGLVGLDAWMLSR